MAVKELVDNYESGRGTVVGWQETVTRVLLVDSYENWRDDPDVPQHGDLHPLNSNLIVVRIDYEGAGALDSESENLHKYKFAKLRVTYSSNAEAEIPLRKGELTAELFEVGGFGQFQTSGNIIDRPRCITLGGEKFNIPRLSVTLPLSTIAGMRNKVNNASWNPDGLCSYGAETVLFLGASYDPYRAPDGTVMYRIDYHFSVNDRGWNCAPDGPGGVWDVVLPKAYTPASFVDFPPA
jgi:hypothetical protein